MPSDGLDLQGDEIAPGAGDDDLGGNDLEHVTPLDLKTAICAAALW